MICGQCHSRPQGKPKNDQPVNTGNKMMLPGTSRNVYLKEYTTREDAGKNDYWADGLHSKSPKYRNGTQPVACSDCHDTHGAAKFAHQMKSDSKSAESCNSCHVNTGT